MPQPQRSVVRSKDGRFFSIPEVILKKYRVKPDQLSASEKDHGAAKKNGKGNGHANGAVQVIINVSPDGRVQTIGANGERAGKQWIYEPPTAGPAVEWGDDFDPTGGMSSAARRG